MGYLTRAEYTLKLIRDPKSYSYINRHYFATGFVLASSIDEATLAPIIQKWKEIDSITSNRIRFLFFIDNEIILRGYPSVPWFTEHGYLKHNDQLLDLARKHGFNLSVKAETQIMEDPNGRTKKCWCPRDRVRKLAQQLGVAQLLPCIIWVRHDEPDHIYALKLDIIAPDNIYLIIREFCDKFYDKNIERLTEIEKIELSIERHCGALDTTLRDLCNVTELLAQKRKIEQILQTIRSISFDNRTWLAQIDQVAEISKVILSLENITKIPRSHFSLAKSIIQWKRRCKVVHEAQSGGNPNRIPIPYLADAITSCLKIEMPPGAARFVPLQRNPITRNEIFLEFLNVALLELVPICDCPSPRWRNRSEILESRQDGKNNRRPIRDRLDSLRSHITKCIKFQNSQTPFTTSNEDIVTILNISMILHELIEQVNVPSSLEDLSSKVDGIFAGIFYDTTLSIAITIGLWMHYRLNDVHKDIEGQIRSSVGSVEYIKRLYNEPQLWHEQVQEPLAKIDEIAKSLQWSALSSYEKQRLIGLGTGLSITNEYHDDTEGRIESMRREVNDNFVPIAAAMSEFGVHASNSSVSNYLDQIKRNFPVLLPAKGLEYDLEDKYKDRISVLFLAADPTDASRLRLGEEFREIQNNLRSAKQRDRFRLEIPQLSVRPTDFSQALLDTKPRIVHFSGHGTTDGALCFENQMGESHFIEPETLQAMFEQFNNDVNCVLLNACYSENQAIAIAKCIDYVIGMKKEISDKAAIFFAIGFYQGLGAGRTIEDAFELGCVQIRMQGIPEYLTPVLIKKHTDPAEVAPPHNSLGLNVETD